MLSKAPTIIALAAAFVLGGGAGYAFSESTQYQQEDRESMERVMDSMSAGLVGKSGDAFDRAFIEEMIPHHAGAIEMAELALQNAKHPEIRAMAEAIIQAQAAEITQMEQWLSDWYGSDTGPTPAGGVHETH